MEHSLCSSDFNKPTEKKQYQTKNATNPMCLLENKQKTSAFVFFIVVLFVFSSEKNKLIIEYGNCVPNVSDCCRTSLVLSAVICCNIYEKKTLI